MSQLHYIKLARQNCQADHIGVGLMMTSRLARDHGLRIDQVDDAMTIISSGVRRCVFTTDDVSEAFFDLKTRLAGEVFQKLINYNCKIALVLPPDHPYGDRVTELAREHAAHPIVRFFPSIEEALAWQEPG